MKNHDIYKLETPDYCDEKKEIIEKVEFSVSGSIEEIENVSGIGPATFNKIKALISVSDHP